MAAYVDALRNSDLTLNPIGMNAECYRIYEAMSYGSVPVIEDRPPSVGSCGRPSRDNDSGRRRLFRLLKLHHAPVIFVTDWRRDLPEILSHEAVLSAMEVVARRRKVVDWYRGFRRKMRDLFVRTIDKRFFYSR